MNVDRGSNDSELYVPLSEELRNSNPECFELDTYLQDHLFSLRWTIENFTYVSTEPGVEIFSRSFQCGGARWKVSLLPHSQDGNGDSVMEARLYGVDVEEKKKVRFKFCLKRKNGAECFVKREAADFIVRNFNKSVTLAKMNAFRDSGVLTNDALTVYFELLVIGNPQHDDWKLVTEKKDASCIVDHRILGESLGDIYNEGKLCDAVLKTPEEFHVHKAVLAAHSPVFAAMFEHGMKEKSSNEVIIKDVEAKAMKNFLQFLYTGRLKGLNVEDTCGVLSIANKYAVEELRAKCLEFLCNSVTVVNFFNLVILTDTLDDPGLNDALNKFFIANMSEVILTRQWDSLVVERPDLANKLKSYFSEVPE